MLDSVHGCQMKSMKLMYSDDHRLAQLLYGRKWWKKFMTPEEYDNLQDSLEDLDGKWKVYNRWNTGLNSGPIPCGSSGNCKAVSVCWHTSANEKDTRGNDNQNYPSDSESIIQDLLMATTDHCSAPPPCRTTEQQQKSSRVEKKKPMAHTRKAIKDLQQPATKKKVEQVDTTNLDALATALGSKKILLLEDYCCSGGCGAGNMEKKMQSMMMQRQGYLGYSFYNRQITEYAGKSCSALCFATRSKLVKLFLANDGRVDLCFGSFDEKEMSVVRVGELVYSTAKELNYHCTQVQWDWHDETTSVEIFDLDRQRFRSMLKETPAKCC